MKKAVSSNPGGTRLLAFKPTTGTPKGSESELTALTYLEFHVLAAPVYQQRGTVCKWVDGGSHEAVCINKAKGFQRR